MKGLCPAVLCLLLVFPVARVQAQVDLFGYYESNGDLVRLPGQLDGLAYHKLRLDLETRPADQILLGANLISQWYIGSHQIDLLDYLDDSCWPWLPDTAGSIWQLETLPMTFADTTFLDNVWLKLEMDRFDLTLGKQQVATGVGYAWNPTDLFNHKNVMDPTYEQRGVNVVRLDLPLKAVTLTGIIQPESTWQASTIYTQIKGNSGRFDLTMLAGRRLGTLYSGESVLREYYGGSAEGEWLGIGWRSEIALSTIAGEYTKWKSEYIVGADYTFRNSLYLLTEFLHSDFGQDAGRMSFVDYMEFWNGARISLNQNYLFLTGLYPLTDVWTAGFLGVGNLDDASAVLQGQVQYTGLQNTELESVVSLFAGDDRDEFGYQRLAGRLRLKVYF